MSTAREITAFVNPFLERHPELRLLKRRVFRHPVRHCLVGIFFTPPHYRGEIIVCWYVNYLFAPPPRFASGFGGAIDQAWGFLGDPGLQVRVFAEMDRVLEQVIPAETSLQTAFDVHKHAPQHAGEMRSDSRALLYTALGRFSEAEGVLEAEVIRQRGSLTKEVYVNGKLMPNTLDPETRQTWEAGIVSLETLLDRLRRGDSGEIAALLHEWEATAARAYGVERYWEPSPFPFEAD